MVKVKTFKELLESTKEIKDSIKRPFIIKKAKKELESKIIDLEAEVAQREIDKEECLQKENVDWDKFIQAEYDLLEAENRLKILTKTLEERFPEKK